MKKYWSWLLLGVLWTSGCMTFTAKKYYMIHLSVPDPSTFAALDKVLLADPTEADSLYDDFRMVYRLSPYEINYYSFNFWSEKPAKLIHNSLLDFLLRSRVFKDVRAETTRDDADLRLKSRLLVIEEIDTENTWYARLAMELEIIDIQSGKTVAFRRFDTRMPLPAKSLSEVSVALSKILEGELSSLLTELTKKEH
jgi:ABC-type uncharacterized transport system auxiliary subunit